MIFVRDEHGVQMKIDETRHWPTNVRGLIGIHAAKSLEGLRGFEPSELPDTLTVPGVPLTAVIGGKMPLGAIIGTVRIATCWRTEIVSSLRSDVQLSWGDYDEGRFAFELVDPVLFSEPIPYRGRQGFFNAEIPDCTRL